MIKPENFYNSLIENGIDFFCGVPDSLLKSFCAYVYEHTSSDRHIITANEGNAIALAAGHYLATGKPGLVYMQNSGIGNAVNPLLSLVAEEVYAIPMLLVIGWRGEPGVKDEPQHIKQGRVQSALLEALELPYKVIDKDTDNLDEIVKELVNLAITGSKPAALIVKKGTFEPYKLESSEESQLMLREEALESILNILGDTVIISTTGKTSREIFEIRERREQEHHDFLTVGSMGHASSIALGVALARPEKKTACIDGDGAMIMHLGSLAMIGNMAPENFIQILMNNFCHESVGGQLTAAGSMDFEKLSNALGYRQYRKAINAETLNKGLSELKNATGPVFLEVIIRKGSRSDLGRPTRSPIENKENFRDYVGKE
jgi:phosphonopyruvate decarboxylase